jgi:phosphoribosylanthranilate isomerase
MTDPQNIRDLAALPVDMIGLIFHRPSPRCITAPPDALPDTAAVRVGVFVNETLDEILAAADRYHLQMIQLHGDETSDTRAALRRRGLQVIKAINVSTADDLRHTGSSARASDLLLFDARFPGSGRKFDWKILNTYAGALPFILAGGINPDDAPAIGQITHPALLAVDLNSRFETAPGVKNIPAIRQFIQNLENNPT